MTSTPSEPETERPAARPPGSAAGGIRFPWPFLVFAFLGLASVWILSGQKPDLKALSGVRFGPLALAAALAVLAIGLDAFRLQLLCWLGLMRLPFFEAVRLVLVYAFFSAITPSSLGGEVSMVWLLVRRGFSTGAAAAVTGMKTFLPVLVCVLAFPTIALAEPEQFHEFLRRAGPVVAVIAAVVATLLVLAFVARAILKKRLALAPSVRAARAQYLDFLRRTLDWIEKTAQDGWDLLYGGFRNRPLVFIGAGLLTIAHALAYLSIVPLCAAAFSDNVRYWECIAGAAVVELLVVFMPTPGGSGGAEAGVAVVVKGFVRPSSLVWVVLFWRLIATHMRVISGGALTVRLFHEMQKARAAGVADPAEANP
jgi:uncharacterized protein (TIRG00374 family)